jgi:glycosyltransferase involved in cell wall biosynthesis
MSRVDVIIPCYKYGRFLRSCVESVLTQPSVDVRVLIIDDCSPDETPEVARELVAEDSRVEYRRHEVNKKHVATYNEGLEWATGDYTVVLSADDLLTPGALGRAAQLMDAHPEVGLVYGKCITYHDDKPLPLANQGEETSKWRIVPGREIIASSCAVTDNLVPTTTVTVRTRVQRELGGYRPELPHTCDMEMWLRFAACTSLGCVAAEQAYHRIHGKNMATSYLEEEHGKREWQQRKATFEILFREYGHRLEEADRLRQHVYRSLAEQAFWAGSRAFDRGDDAACQQYLDWALETYPAVQSWPPWSRLGWKRMVGARIWSKIAPLMRRFRRRPTLS